MLKLIHDFVRYFLTAKNHLISSAFKFMFFSFGGLRPPPPQPPTGAAPLGPLPPPPQYLVPIIFSMFNDY